jgi:hypothetical protein
VQIIDAPRAAKTEEENKPNILKRKNTERPIKMEWIKEVAIKILPFVNKRTGDINI